MHPPKELYGWIVLPLAAGEAYRQGYIRPGLSLSGDLNENIHLFASGLYWNRDLKQEDDYDLDWAESRISGGAAWDTPWGPTIAVSGVSHRTESDFIDYEASWSRIDFTAAAGRNDMPLGLQAQAEVTYSLYGGNDFLDREIDGVPADRDILPACGQYSFSLKDEEYYLKGHRMLSYVPPWRKSKVNKSEAFVIPEHYGVQRSSARHAGRLSNVEYFHHSAIPGTSPG